MGFFSSIANITLKPSVWAGNLITSGLEKITGKTYGRQTSRELSETTFGKVLGTSIGVTAGALIVAVSPSTSAKVGRSVLTFAKANPIKTGIGALVVAPALATSSKLRSGATAGIKELPTFGSDIGKVIQGDKGLGEFIKEHPILSSGTAIAGAVVGGKVLAPVIGGALAGRGRGVTINETPVISGVPVGQGATSPLLPERVNVSPTKKPTARRRVTKPQRISQSVRVNVIASPKATGLRMTNKRYIRERILN